MIQDLQKVELPEGKTIRDLERLAKALGDLGPCAHREDITQTAADLKLSVETVRRYLRGLIYDFATADSINTYLRKLTLARTHSIQKILKAA